MRRLRARRRSLGAIGTALILTATTGIAYAATIAPPSATMSANERKAGYGQRVKLSGAVPGAGDQRVAIAFRPAARKRWIPIKKATTDAAGEFSTRVRVRRSGAWRAVPRGGEASRTVPIRVRSGLRLRSKRGHAISGRVVRLRGRLRPARGSRRVVVQVHRGGGWHTVGATRTRRNGRFSIGWKPRRTGSYRARAIFRGDRVAGANRDRANRRVRVYRVSSASWYGPGLYGNSLACGGRLHRGTVGVAHKTMPCGKRLTLRHRGRAVRARVIDRGPFVAGRELDLTEATARKLRFSGHGRILVRGG